MSVWFKNKLRLLIEWAFPELELTPCVFIKDNKPYTTLYERRSVYRMDVFIPVVEAKEFALNSMPERGRTLLFRHWRDTHNPRVYVCIGES